MLDDWSELPGPRGAQLAKRLYGVLDANGDGKLDFEVRVHTIGVVLLRTYVSHSFSFLFSFLSWGSFVHVRLASCKYFYALCLYR